MDKLWKEFYNHISKLFHIKIKLLTGKEFLDIFVPGFFYAFIHGNVFMEVPVMH